MTGTEIVRVDLNDRAYDIVIGTGVLEQTGALTADFLSGSDPVVVTDENVAGLHLDVLSRSLKEVDIEHKTIVLPPGEQTKNFDNLECLLDKLLTLGIDRSTLLIAFGGGVVGDLAGFAAAIALRGLDFIQIPTTLLAQVDSSVGGKTAIDMRQGKNLVGAFHQPKLVLADMGVLDTLPHREFLAGYAEVVKYGLIGDQNFFSWLETHGAGLIGGNVDARRYAVMESCKTKARIVMEDEEESGNRALLNFGHTFAHALEAEAGFGETMLHGEAVAIGIILAFDLSVSLGFCAVTDANRVRRHFNEIGLEYNLRSMGQGVRCSPDRLLEHMSKDKKVRAGRKTFVLARMIGDAFVNFEVSDEQVIAILREALA